MLEFALFGLSAGAAFAYAQKLVHVLYTPGVMPFVATILLIVFGFISGWSQSAVFYGAWFGGYVVGAGLIRPWEHGDRR